VSNSRASIAAATIAAIDIGTNTTLMLVARSRPGEPQGEPQVLAEAAEITRLGRGIGAGAGARLGDEGIARTLEVLRRYAALAASHGASGPAHVAAVGTEALRRAGNAAAFLEPAAAVLGAPVEVIDGEREAALTFRAVLASFPEVATRRALVIDIGGGSTEVVAADGGRVALRSSLPIGSVRLTERHVRGDPPAPAELAAMERDIDEQLGRIPQAFATGGPTPPLLVGVAGTVTSLAAMAAAGDTGAGQDLGQDLKQDLKQDPGLVHGHTLSAAGLDRQIARLGAATQAQRETMPGLDPRRADVILAGALVLRAIVRRSGAAAVLVSDRGIRWGLYLERRSSLAGFRG
jgi:exopolyphosphatase / guanosine-5'-triphosphate,3'-diphosphate pyrophosphatase